MTAIHRFRWYQVCNTKYKTSGYWNIWRIQNPAQHNLNTMIDTGYQNQDYPITGVFLANNFLTQAWLVPRSLINWNFQESIENQPIHILSFHDSSYFIMGHVWQTSSTYLKLFLLKLMTNDWMSMQSNKNALSGGGAPTTHALFKWNLSECSRNL